MMRHVVRAEREGRYWLVWIDGELRTQARHQREVEPMARDWLANALGADTTDDEIDVEFVLPSEARDHLERARVLRERADRARTDASRETAAAALVLHQAGLTVREIGPLLEVSFQRAQQLVASAR